MGILMLNGNNYTGGIQQVYGSSSGNIATFDDGGDNKPLKSLKVAINPVQDLHGYDSPWVGGAGKNKLPSINQTQTINGVVWTLQSDGSIKLSGTAKDNSVYDFGRSDNLTLKRGSYFATESRTNYSVTIFKVVDGSASPYKNGGGAFSISEDAEIFMRVVVLSGTSINETLYPMIESGSTATTYEPYSNICPISGWDEVKVVVSPTTDAEDGITHTIQLGSTCYGGKLDVLSGVLRVDRVYVKGGWTQYASSNGYKAWRNALPNPKGSNLLCNPISNMISEYGSFSSLNMNRNIVQLNSASEVTEVTSYMALQEDVNANEVKLCYELATPITVQLTPTQINSLLGNNNIWSDTGEILECVYQRDLNLVINQFDERITALEQALNSSGTRGLSLSKSAVKEEETKEEITEEPKEEEQNEDKR